MSWPLIPETTKTASEKRLDIRWTKADFTILIEAFKRNWPSRQSDLGRNISNRTLIAHVLAKYGSKDRAAKSSDKCGYYVRQRLPCE